jgi:nicotinamidase-related amidase
MRTALVVIDMQRGMADRVASGREIAVPEAAANVARLLALFRQSGKPVIHVLHDDPDPASPFRKGRREAEPMPEAVPAPGEVVFVKHGSSAFAGTGLDAHLKAEGIGRIVLCGAVAAFCVTSTTRWASDLGYQVLLPQDALMAFEIEAHDGGRIGAAEVLRVTLSLLGSDFARLITTAGAEAELEAPQPAI